MKQFLGSLGWVVAIAFFLHYGAFLIAWGIAKGWAKVTHVVTHTGTQTQIHTTAPAKLELESEESN